MDPNKEKKFNRSFSAPSEMWDKGEAYIKRRERIEEIWKEANDLRIARCEAKMKEVGKEKFMDLIHSGEWSDSEEMTEIEKEYCRLSNEEFLEDWEREHGKPYRMEDDPNAQF